MLPEGFPAVLRELVEAELAAGNEIAEVGVGFPSPPVGGWVKLAKMVSTRPRVKTPTVDFYERHMPGYSGEFTDAKRFFFVLEPPLPPPEPVDMDKLRESYQPKATAVPLPAVDAPPAERPRRERAPVFGLVEEFRRSMSIDYEKWREGIGYDVSLIGKAGPREHAAIESMLLARPVEDWRDVEALAVLDTPAARAALQRALKSSNHRVATAVASYAPSLLSNEERTAILVRALEGADIYGGLTQALLQVEEFHPPEVIAALWRGLRQRSDDSPVHFAAMLVYLHGQAASSFDWDQRPFFLRFGSDDGAERERAYRELCERLGGDPNEGGAG